MAKKKKRTLRKKTTSSQKQENEFITFLKSERLRFIMGVVVAFIGIFMLLAIISFFFTGAADQSKVLNKSFMQLIRSNVPEVDNWTGAGGAYIAEILVNDWFGIFSTLIPIFLIYIGLRMMKVSDLSFLKALFITTFGVISGSIASAFILDRIFPGTHIKWGGGTHGIQIEQILDSSVGWPGIVLIILLFIVIVAVLIRKSSMYKIQQKLVNSKPSFTMLNDEEQTSTDECEIPESDEEKKAGLIKRFFAFF